MRARIAGSLSLIVASLTALGAIHTTAHAATACSKYAATNGTDTSAGTAATPYRTVNRLVASLTAGQVGCLRDGAYTGGARIDHGGAPGNPITLTTDPASPSRAVVSGRFYVTDAANDVTISNLFIDGRGGGAGSPVVNGDRVTFSGNEVTNYNTEICFILGSSIFGRAVGVVIDGNRIHNCGALPSSNMDHGIYVAAANGVRITNNYIYDNVDRGVQLYPDAQGTLVANNVIDGNGEGVIISGEGGLASSGSVVRDNVITNSTIRNNVESSFPSAVGTGNVVTHNCVFGGRQGNIGPARGFTAIGNVTADPLYLNRGAKDFALRAGSPCAGMGPAVTTSAAPAADPAPPPTRPLGHPAATRKPRPRVHFVFRGVLRRNASHAGIRLLVRSANRHGRGALAGARTVTLRLNRASVIRKGRRHHARIGVLRAGDRVFVRLRAPLGTPAAGLPALRLVVDVGRRHR
ncbi:MAG TPA: right-handed parallel beta-helix repeat-containing protein [Miltoncostaeaceae bacterium]|nr:right-handed parallel beta-helix repeat-containing protein [Miltoncostaeaceae bacterium]